MVKNKISLTLSVVLLLMLSACSIGTSNPNDQLIGDPPLINAVEMTVLTDVVAPITTVGHVIKYSYIIKNTGTVPLPGVVSVVGATATCQAVNTIGNNDEFLDVGEAVTCESTYITVQADLDRGSITIVTSADVNGTRSAEVATKVDTVPNRILTMTKTANPTTYDSIGQLITYTYVVTNSGTLDIGPTQFVVADAGMPTPLNCGNADVTLAANATITCALSYAVTQADMDAGIIATTATVTGGGVGPSQPASATVTKGDISNLTPGTTVQHTVIEGEWLWQIARCYGADPKQVLGANSQLPNPAMIKAGTIVSVPNIGSAGKIYQTKPAIPCIKYHTVASGDTWSSIALFYNADQAVLQMVNSNNLAVGNKIKVPINSAGGTVTVSKALSLTKTSNPLTYSQAGQVITYTYVIKNSGTTTLGPAQFTVSDSLISTAPINCGVANTTLAPNTTVTCTAAYTITQADMTATSITNIATASGGGVGPSASASATVNKSVTLLTLTTTANPVTYSQAGQVITFTYVIKNTGTTTLGPAQFTVSDGLISAAPINCGDANTTIAANATVTCNAAYTVTQADMTAVSITNIATASGGGAGPSQSASATVNKSVTLLTLTTAAVPSTYNQAGQVITFTYVIKNSGNTTLGPAQFTISDGLVSAAPKNCGDANTTLAPETLLTCTATYTITQADMTAVSITNIATASGGGAGPSQPASTTVNKQ